MEIYREKKKLNLTIFVIFGIFFLFLILNLSINLTDFGDDGHLFLEPLSKKFNGNEIAYLIDRYHSWSSRLIIEYFTLLSVQHHIFWKVLNSIAMTTVAVVPIFVFDFKKNKFKLMITSASLLLFLPISMLNGAGWIATTTNYLWVLACFWGFMLITVNIIRLNKINWFSYIFSLFLVAYASNLEQANILLILCIIALCFYMYKTKRKFLFLLPSFFISLANLLFILTTPGNNVRYARSVVHWFPDYESLTFLRKCELSFSSSFRELFFLNQLLFFILTLVIAFALYKSKQGFQTFIAFLPIVTHLAFNTFYQTLSDQIPELTKIKESFTPYGTNFSMNHPKTWITDLLIITIISAIFFAIYFIFKDEPSKAMILIGILILGIITKMILGFSPTVWASGLRTSIFLYSSISVLILCIMDKFKQNQLLFGIINSLGFLCLLNFLLIPS